MLAAIDEQILQRINTKGLPVDITGATLPAAYASLSGGAIKKTTQTRLRMDITANLNLVFQSTTPETTRRTVIYPIIQQALEILTLQDLGIAIDPLVPAGFQETTTVDEAAAGLIVYRMQFKTFYYIERIDDEVPVDLLKIGMEYYLQDPVDDGVKDAEDEVTLGP